MEKYYFDAENHLYYINGKPATGVTTILKILAKDALIQWAANEAVDYIETLARTRSDGERYVLLDIPEFKLARTAHRRKKEASADIGKLVHKAVELYIAKEPKCLEHIPQELMELAKKMFDNFTGWAETNKVEFLASEQQVYSEKYFYAGTFDFLCKIDGKTYLGDLKTSSGIYPEYFYQTAAYQMALQEMKDQNIDGHIIVNITKKGELNIKYSCDYELDRQAFLAALTLYRRKYNDFIPS